MKSFPQVDVVIPTYNGAGFLADAINSVLQQTLSPKEIIIVDDGSTDNTNAILKTFEDTLKVIKHPGNRGLSAARNTGILAGSSPLIAFLDADDVWVPNKLERQLPEFTKDETLGLCYTSLIDCDTGMSPLGKPRNFRRRVSERVFHELFTNPFPMPPSTVIVSREAIIRCGCFDETILKSEDYECWLRMAMLYPVSCVPEPLCYRRLHSQAISSTHAVGEKLKWEFEIIDRCASAAEDFNIILPMSVHERRIFSTRRRLRKALLYNDKAEASFYKDKLKDMDSYSILDRLVNVLLAARTSFLVSMTPITMRVKALLRKS